MIPEVRACSLLSALLHNRTYRENAGTLHALEAASLGAGNPSSAIHGVSNDGASQEMMLLVVGVLTYRALDLEIHVKEQEGM
jgi:hypothetical protein